MSEEALGRRDNLRGLVLSALGSHLAKAVVERIAKDLRVRAKPGEALTLRYSPGYCGMGRPGG